MSRTSPPKADAVGEECRYKAEAIGGVPSSPLAEARAEEIKFSYHTIFIGELTCGGNLPAKPVLELPKHIAPMNRGGLPAKTTMEKYNLENSNCKESPHQIPNSGSTAGAALRVPTS